MASMHLYVAPMDSIVVDFSEDGRIKLLDEDWSVPSLQEQRAVIYAARDEIARLTELVEALETTGARRTGDR
jgi:hypothetical protein